MNAKDFSTVADALFKKMEYDRYSQSTINTARYVLEHFQNYCAGHNISDITLSDAEHFTKTCLGFDFHSHLISIQSMLRRPLLIFFEFESTGRFAKTHRRESVTHVPDEFKETFESYKAYTDSLDLKKSTKRRRILVLEKYLCHIRKDGISQLSSAPVQSVHTFTETLDGYALTTQRALKNCLRLSLDWLLSTDTFRSAAARRFP